MEVEIDTLELQFSLTVLLRVKEHPLACEGVHVRHCLCMVLAIH